jgi:plastocyanin
MNSNIRDFTLSAHTVRVGDTIVWTNSGAEPHTSTSGVLGVFDSFGGGGWNSGLPLLLTNDTYSHTFTSVGTFPYTCIVHPEDMNSTITVTN